MQHIGNDPKLLGEYFCIFNQLYMHQTLKTTRRKVERWKICLVAFIQLTNTQLLAFLVSFTAKLADNHPIPTLKTPSII